MFDRSYRSFDLTNGSQAFTISVMRSLHQSLPPGRSRDIVLVGAATMLVGASFGAIAVGAGLPFYLPILLSVVVFAGAAQFMFVGIVAAGGSVLAATAAGLLVNLRHVPFGVSIGDVFESRWREKIVGSYLMSDETVAFTVAETSAASRRATYWICGAVLFVSWNVGVLVGTFGGAFVGEPDALGLDAAFPAVLLALVMPSLRDRVTRRAAVLGLVIAVASAPFLPAGLPVLLALFGVIAGTGRSRTGSVMPADNGTP